MMSIEESNYDDLDISVIYSFKTKSYTEKPIEECEHYEMLRSRRSLYPAYFYEVYGEIFEGEAYQESKSKPFKCVNDENNHIELLPKEEVVISQKEDQCCITLAIHDENGDFLDLIIGYDFSDRVFCTDGNLMYYRIVCDESDESEFLTEVQNAD